MIEKLVRQKLTIAGKEYEYPDTTALVGKFNELVDAVNKLETMAKNTNTVLESLVKENNIHEKQIDELQMKLEPEKCESAKNAHKSDLEEALEGFPGLFKSNKDEPLVDALMRDVKRTNQNVNFGQPEVKKNHKIRSTNERLREALSLAENALIRLANDAYDMDEHIYIDGILNQI